jgi:hypothetical protein
MDSGEDLGINVTIITGRGRRARVTTKDSLPKVLFPLTGVPTLFRQPFARP